MSKFLRKFQISFLLFARLTSSQIIEQTNIETFGGESMDVREPTSTNQFIIDPVQYKYEKTYDGLGTWQSGIIGSDYAQL